MPDAPINRAPLPVRPPTPWFKLIWPHGTAPLTVVFLSDDFSAAWSHHWSGRTTPCYGDGICEDCARQAPRYLAFAPVWHPDPQPLAVFRFSEWAAGRLTSIRAQAGTLRGRKVTCRRRPGRPNAPVDLTDEGPVARPELLPPEFDPWPSVNRVLGVPPGWRPSRLPSLEAIAASALPYRGGVAGCADPTPRPAAS